MYIDLERDSTGLGAVTWLEDFDELCIKILGIDGFCVVDGICPEDEGTWPGNGARVFRS